MVRTLLMPKATAVWLVDHTALTFDQIADFCGLHVLEVKGIADGDVAQGIRGLDPITGGQITRQEIERGEADPGYKLRITSTRTDIPNVKTRRVPRYTPLSRRQDRPKAILWLLRHHPGLKDGQIIRLVRTTRPTILAIRERRHWNSAHLQPQDPVTLGLCSQTELNAEVQKITPQKKGDASAGVQGTGQSETLLPVNEVISGFHRYESKDEREQSANKESTGESAEEKNRSDADAVFAKRPRASGDHFSAES